MFKTEFHDIYTNQLKKIKNAIITDVLSFKKTWEDSSGFSVFHLNSYEYCLQKYLEKRLEHYIRIHLITGLIGRMLTNKGVGITYPMNYKENEILTNEEFEKIHTYEFIADYGNARVMYRYCDWTQEEAMDYLKNDEFIDEVNIIQWNSFVNTKKRDSDFNVVNMKHVSPNKFFINQFGMEEYEFFITFMETTIINIKDYISVKSVPMLSNHYLCMLRFEVEKSIEEYTTKMMNFWETKKNMIERNVEVKDFDIGYDIIGTINKQKYPNVPSLSEKLLFKENLLDKFVKNKMYRYLIGVSDFAKSFMTAEYMYAQHKEDYHFDYTAVAAGYLKSIEQLLFSILKLNFGKKGYWIKYNGYRSETDPLPEIKEDRKHIKRVELIQENIDYMDTTIGSLIAFFKFYKETILISDKLLRKTIIDCLNCYRDECRNGSFHKNNIKVKSKLEFIRTNTLFLYIILLAGFRLGESSYENDTNFGAIKSLKLERLYYMISNSREIEIYFGYYGDDNYYEIPVKLIECDMPMYDENGIIKSIHLKFESKDNNKNLILVNEWRLPHDIWIVNSKGEKILFE